MTLVIEVFYQPKKFINNLLILVLIKACLKIQSILNNARERQTEGSLSVSL